jgi:hypothetical protein
MIVVPMVQVSRGLRIEVSLPALASGLTLLIGLVVWPTYPDGQIVEQQRSAQRLIGKPAVNARLYRLHDGGQLNQPVLSNYFYLNYLPELSSLNRLIQCGECSVPALLRDIAVTSDAGFILLEDGFLPARTVHRIGHCAGIETVFVEGTVRLLHVDRRQLDETCFIDPETIRPLIEKLYPSETSVGRGFNVQPDGSSALGVACRNGSQTNVIVWAGTQLDSVYAASTALTAQVPARLYAKPGHYPIEILDKDSGLRSPAVNFEVK